MCFIWTCIKEAKLPCFRAGVESGGGGPSSFGASLSGMGVWNSVSANPDLAVGTFLELDLLCGFGAVSPPYAITFVSRSFLGRLKPVDALIMGICVHCATSTSSAASIA